MRGGCEVGGGCRIKQSTQHRNRSEGIRGKGGELAGGYAGQQHVRQRPQAQPEFRGGRLSAAGGEGSGSGGEGSVVRDGAPVRSVAPARGRWAGTAGLGREGQL